MIKSPSILPMLIMALPYQTDYRTINLLSYKKRSKRRRSRAEVRGW